MEDFTGTVLKDVRFLSDLKLRASHGQTGNQEGIGLYDYLARAQLQLLKKLEEQFTEIEEFIPPNHTIRLDAAKYLSSQK